MYSAFYTNNENDFTSLLTGKVNLRAYFMRGNTVPAAKQAQSSENILKSWLAYEGEP